MERQPARPPAHLATVTGFAEDRRFPLGDLTWLGRSESCSIVLAFHGVSRRHCSIVLVGDEFVLEDHQSANGTKVNGELVTQVTTLHDGDRITVGPYVLDVVCDAAPQPSVSFEERSLEPSRIMHAVSVGESTRPFVELAATANETQLRALIDKLQILLGANEVITQIADPIELFSLLLEQIFAVLPARRGVVLMGSDPTSARPVARRTAAEGVDTLPISRTLLRRVYAYRQALVVHDVPNDTSLRNADSLQIDGMSSVVCAPLVHGERVLGAIQIDSPQVGAFEAIDLQIIAALAQQAATSLENWQLAKRMRTEARIRGNLERYLPRDLVEAVVADRVGLEPGGSTAEVTLLFADLRYFNERTRDVDAKIVVDSLNEFFAYMVDQIFRYGGTLDKFIGDAVMAMWGAPLAKADDPLRAVHCALDMQAALEELNVVRFGRSQPALIMGIGLHIGTAVVGSVGSDRRMEYTAVGPTVSFASELEKHAKPGQVAISEPLYERVQSQVAGEWGKPVVFDGVKGRQRLFVVHSMSAPGAPDGQDAAAPRHYVRAAERAHTMVRGHYRELDTLRSFPVIVRDISLSGAGMVVSLPQGAKLSKGSRLEVAIALEGETVIIPAELRNISRLGSDSGNLHRVGVQWQRVGGRIRKALKRLLRDA